VTHETPEPRRLHANNVHGTSTGLAAFDKSNQPDDHRPLEFAPEIATDECDFPVGNPVFAGAVGKSDADDAAGLREEVAVA